MGIVDAVRVRHLGEIAVSYDRTAAEVERAEAMRRYGFDIPPQFDAELGLRWPAWRRRPQPSFSGD
jgi:hypothetical protein